MSVEDRQRWDDRYRQASTAIEPRPPVALELSGIAVPTGGRALDVACGSGSVSVWLAQRGFEVLGVDVSPVALAAARDLASAHGVDGTAGKTDGTLARIDGTATRKAAGSARFEAIDLDDGLPRGDGELGRWDLVVCQRFRDPAHYADLAAAVAPGGLLVITVLSTVGHVGDPGPFRAVPGELVGAFGGVLDILWSSEADGESHLVARRP
ncbi:MAG: methyltransferase domain-containing protein [Acidimicrobiales bacterium]